MTTDLIVSFPAAGSGGSTMEQLEKLAARRGAAYLAAANPPRGGDAAPAAWLAASVERMRQAADRAAAARVLLVGHCMGGLTARRLADGLGAQLGRPVGVLLVNTPCPDDAGRIPTLSALSDAGIAAVLARDGFPAELLEDADMLAEIAAGLRAEARVADGLADWVRTAPALESLHVLATRGDTFVPPQWCAGWLRRVSGDFHLTVAAGGHAIDESSAGLLGRAVDGLAAAIPAGPAVPA